MVNLENFEPKYELVDPDHDILREELPQFDFANPPVDPVEFAHELTQHMLYYNGIGLAANQLGLPYRAFAIRSDPVLVCYNPIVVDWTEKEELYDEGCLTFPHLFMKIKRPSSIKVRYVEPNGNIQNAKYTGLSARVFLHEYDHVQGVLFIDRVSDVKLKMAEKKAKKYKKTYNFDVSLPDEVVGEVLTLNTEKG